MIKLLGEVLIYVHNQHQLLALFRVFRTFNNILIPKGTSFDVNCDKNRRIAWNIGIDEDRSFTQKFYVLSKLEYLKWIES